MLGPEIAADLVAQCQMAAGEIGQAIGRAFDRMVEASVAGEPESLSFAAMADELDHAGLVVLLHVGSAAAAILVPQTVGLMPAWYASPDRSAQSKLTTLAQELGMLVLPEAFMADDCQSARVDRLSIALDEGGAADGVTLVRMTLRSVGVSVPAMIVWPLATPHDIKRASSAPAPEKPAMRAGPDGGANVLPDSGMASPAMQPDTNPSVVETPAPASPASSGDIRSATPPRGSAKGRHASKSAPKGPTLRDLPIYTRSLLKIRVPLSVTLASKKQPVGQILQIGLGSIIQFEKSCEEMLDLNVNNLPIARGEAVKVGEKFGLRVTSLILPGERFKPIQRPADPHNRRR